MIFDGHTHIFPEMIAKKASDNIGDFYDIEMEFDGTVEALIKEGEASGISKFLVHSVATTPKQIDSINLFISKAVERYPDKFVGFMTLHPDSENLKEQFNWAIEHGLRGVKLHPDFQKFNIDDEKAKEIYKLAEGVCPVLIHMGDSRTTYSKPYRLKNILDEFENLDVIGAHFGGYSEWDDAVECLSSTRAYVDTSSSLFALSPKRAKELIDIYGKERVIFGTDYPMWKAEDELKHWEKIDVSEDEWEWISHKTLETLLKKYER